MSGEPAVTDRGLRFAVVGGGMAGMAAAEALGESGHSVEIFEAGAGLGGRIVPEVLGEREISMGGKNIGYRYERFRELLARRGFDRDEYFGPDSGQLVRGKVRNLSFSDPKMRARIGMRLFTHAQVGRGMRRLGLRRPGGDGHCAVSSDVLCHTAAGVPNPSGRCSARTRRATFRSVVGRQ